MGLFLKCEPALIFLLKAQQEQCHVTFSAIIMFLIFKFLFLAALGPCCCLWAFSPAWSRACSLVAVRRPLIVVVFLVAEHGL